MSLASEVTELAIGDQVAVDAQLYCFECHYCRLYHDNRRDRRQTIGRKIQIQPSLVSA